MLVAGVVLGLGVALGACAGGPQPPAPTAALEPRSDVVRESSPDAALPLETDDVAQPAAADPELSGEAPQLVGAKPDPIDEDAELADEDRLADEDWELAEEDSEFAEDDPLEPVNRGVFGVNRVFDRWLFDPAARLYGWAVPDPGKRAVNRFFDNLNEPVVLVNDLLQLQPRRAACSGGRFVVNTTIGIAGLLDVATPLGIEAHTSDFGETLARAGLGPGAYLVLPLLGPSTVRDAFGQIVDVVLRPDTWLLTPGGRLVLYSTGGVARREALLEELEELERSSIDYYAALRSAYLMSRERAIREDGD